MGHITSDQYSKNRSIFTTNVAPPFRSWIRNKKFRCHSIVLPRHPIASTPPSPINHPTHGSETTFFTQPINDVTERLEMETEDITNPCGPNDINFDAESVSSIPLNKSSTSSLNSSSSFDH